jgi:REP element-mobilizing transposase RayT
MAQLFKNKYRVSSARLEGWDYRRNAMYFVTICTKERRHYFGEITDEKMMLTDTGKLCRDYLYRIPEFSPFVVIDEAIVMPNHLHAIIVIDNSVVETFEKTSRTTETINTETFPTETINTETFFQTSLQGETSISPKSGSLSTIIRSFKGAVKKDSKTFDPSFEWQTRFHDHIIRNPNSYWNIKKYIQTNVENWKEDRFFNPGTPHKIPPPA